MDSFPIELIENILRFCRGSQFCVSSRVSTNWLIAKENIERTDHSFWRNRCKQEIERSLVEDLNPYHKPLSQLDSTQCRQLYIKWFRSQKIDKMSNHCSKYNETYGSTFSNFESVTALIVTGNLVITGHRSGRVLINDVLNKQKAIEILRQLAAINDLVAINLVGDERYELHKTKDYPTAFPSFSNHHHIVAIGEGSRINVSLIADKNMGKTFEICPLLPRNFLKGRVCRDLLAVSTKQAVDISLFRLSLPTPGKVPIEQPVKVEMITTVSCRQVFNSPFHWLGLFTFSDLKLSCFSHEFNLITCSDVALNLSILKKENQKWKWSSINELIYEFHSKHKVYDYYDELNVRITNGFSFGDQIFFLITNYNETVFSTDAKTFHLCEINHWLRKGDKVLSISLFGAVLACGTSEGYVYIFDCPTMNRLKYMTHYKPIFTERISKEPVFKIYMTDSGVGPVLGVVTKHKVYLVNWTSEQNQWVQRDLKNDSNVEVITID